MNLKKTILLVIAGLFYILLYKLINTIFPSLNNLELFRIISSALWLISTFTIIMFAFYFLKEIKPILLNIRISLISIIVFTILILIVKLPIEITANYIQTKRIILDSVSLLNALAILIFLKSFYSKLTELSILKKSLGMTIWGYFLNFLLGLISFVFYIVFLISGKEIHISPIITIFAFAVFIFTYFVTINFLIKFEKVEDYSKLGLHS